MKISHTQLTTLDLRGIKTVQSSFNNIAYAIDKRNGSMWIIDRNTGAQIEVSQENIHAWAMEIMDIADIFLSRTGVFVRAI
jgi:hypothetical protein